VLLKGSYIPSNGAGEEAETKKLFDGINETLLYPVHPVNPV
jgi:hypothetical protein